ncbi:MAG TPA: molybdenum cofactor biosynthesis protein MoaE [Abditibacteriaceae bacterium]|jgi:molybdopterin synthase catalytic subunit
MNSSATQGIDGVEKFTARVLLFASLRDKAGENVAVTLQRGATVADLLMECEKENPAIAPWLPHVRVAVNCEYAENTQIVNEGDELALLPPVSGGSASTVEIDRTPTFVDVVTEPIHLEQIVAWAQDALQGGAGAVVPFIGVVRNNAQGRDVRYLEYHAYPQMARREMERIARETGERWHVPCAIVHRVGTLQIGEASIVVAVASPHRGEAFEACRWALDQTKATVPIWKREVATDGTYWVEDPLNGQTNSGAG